MKLKGKALERWWNAPVHQDRLVTDSWVSALKKGREDPGGKQADGGITACTLRSSVKLGWRMGREITFDIHSAYLFTADINAQAAVQAVEVPKDDSERLNWYIFWRKPTHHKERIWNLQTLRAHPVCRECDSVFTSLEKVFLNEVTPWQRLKPNSLNQQKQAETRKIFAQSN